MEKKGVALEKVDNRKEGQHNQTLGENFFVGTSSLNL